MSRAELLIQLWGLDPSDPTALFVSGSSDRVPPSPIEMAAEGEETKEELRNAKEVIEDLTGQLEDVRAIIKRLALLSAKTSRATLATTRKELAELDSEITATLAEHKASEDV